MPEVGEIDSRRFIVAKYSTTRIDRGAAMRWIPAVAGGWVLAWFAGLWIGGISYAVNPFVLFLLSLDSPGATDAAVAAAGATSGLIGGLCGGVVAGVGQVAALARSHRRRPELWGACTAAAFAAVLSLTWARTWPAPYSTDGAGIVIAATVGGLIAFGQGLAVRLPFSSAIIWALVSTVAWFACLATTLLPNVAFMVPELLGGVALGGLTLLGLAAMLLQELRQARNGDTFP